MFKSIASVAVMFTLMILCSSMRIQAQENRPYSELRVATERYLNVFSTKNDLDSISKKLKNRIESIREDGGVTEEDAMGSFLLGWGMSNQSKLEQKDRPTMIQFCYYFIQFMEKGYRIPEMMEYRMPAQKMKQLISWLNRETADTRIVMK